MISGLVKPLSRVIHVFIKAIVSFSLVFLLPIAVMSANEISHDLKILERATAFSHGEILGQSTKNETYAAYKRICINWTSLDRSELDRMLQDATPAGKLYAAALISEINCFRGQPQAMKSGFEKLKNDDSKVAYCSGREVSEHKISELASSFISKGEFKDFGLSRWCEKPISGMELAQPAAMPNCILTLSKANRFYGPTPGESGPSPWQSAYVEATGKVGILEMKDMEWLLQNGSPAGRIYGAVLLWQSSKVGPNLSYGKLTDDGSAVEYQDGCKVMNSTVREIAKSLMETGSFMNFKVGSMFCKLKAPTDKP